MADLEDLQQKEIVLDMSNVPRDQRADLKDEVGQFIVDSILEKLSKGQSPVAGESFQKLDKDYAKNFKGGNRTPNLELEGDLLASLGFRNTRNGIAVGILDAKERPKADGHNNFSGDSKIPTRRFIPGSDQSFKSDIESGIQNIVDKYAVSEQDIRDEAQREIASGELPGGGVSVNLSDLLSNDSIVELLLERLSRGR